MRIFIVENEHYAYFQKYDGEILLFSELNRKNCSFFNQLKKLPVLISCKKRPILGTFYQNLQTMIVGIENIEDYLFMESLNEELL